MKNIKVLLALIMCLTLSIDASAQFNKNFKLGKKNSSNKGTSSPFDFKSYLYEKYEIAQRLYSSESVYRAPKGADYLQSAQDYNREEVQKKLKRAKLIPNNSSSTKMHIRTLEDFHKNYDQFVNEVLTGKINELIEKAYSYKTSNVGLGLNFAQEAKDFTDGIKLISPNHSKISELSNASEKVLTALGGSASNNTSAFHKENLNEIVWSNKPLSIGSESTSDIKNSFETGETIYGTAYLGRSVRAANGKDSRLDIRLRIDDKQMTNRYECHLQLENDEFDNNYVQFVLVPNPSSYNASSDIKKGNYTTQRFNEELSRISPRKHKVEITLLFDVDKASEVKGNFNIDLSGDQTFYEKIANKISDSRFADIQLPTARMNDGNLEQAMVKSVNNQGRKETFTNAIITNQNWTNITEGGALVARKIDGACVGKNSKGECVYQIFSFRQNYNGNGFGETYQHSSEEVQKIPCANVK